MGRVSDWLRRKVRDPLVAELRQGATPEAVSAAVVASFVAMWLLSKKRVESWIYWIVVDVVAIWLYFIKDVKFLSLLYVILLGIAINGYLTWRRSNSDTAHA